MKKLSSNGDITVGFPHSPDAKRFNEFVLKHTLCRPLYTQSWLKRPGTECHDAAHVDSLRVELSAKCDIINAGMNIPFYEDRIGHNCYSTEDPSGRCCDDTDKSKDKLETSPEAVSDFLLDGLRELAPNKWKSRRECSQKIGLGVLTNNSLGRGFGNSLATAAQLRKARSDVQKLVARQQAGEIVGEANKSEILRLLRGRPTVKGDGHLNGPDVPYLTLMELVGSMAIDMFYHTPFDAEQLARRECGRRRPGSQVIGLLQSMASPDGILLQVYQQLASAILENDATM